MGTTEDLSGNNVIRTMCQVKISGAGPKGRRDGEKLQAGNEFIARPITASWGRRGACMDIPAAEAERRKGLPDTMGEPWTTSWRQKKHRFAGE